MPAPGRAKMARTHRLSATRALIMCLVATQWSSASFASEQERLSREAPASQSLTNNTSETQVPASARLAAAIPIDQHPAMAGDFSSVPPAPPDFSHFTFNFVPTQSSAFARQVYQGRPIPMRRRRDGSVAAIMIGAVTSITGAAILVYANRPECSTNQCANLCGYGTKVVGGAVLSTGIVGLFVGALTWR
jgi:hypothetical protein